MTVNTYISRPTEIEAIRWTGNNWDDVRAWCDDHVLPGGLYEMRVKLYVAANEAWVIIERGEWIAKDRHGFYPVKDDVFIDKYRQVASDTEAHVGDVAADETQSLTFRVADRAATDIHRLKMFLFASKTIDQQAYAAFVQKCKRRDRAEAPDPTPSEAGDTMTTFRTELKLGERYRDTATGFEGSATSICFYQHGCERVTLKGINKQGEIIDYAFDAPELEHIASQNLVQVIEAKTGGPHDRTPMRRR
jgi:hypothetical protein